MNPDGTASDTESPHPATVYPRHGETFPTLTTQEIDRLRRFGVQRTYANGERMIETGARSPGMFIILSGHVTVTQRDGLGHVTPLVDQGPGQFVAEIAQLSNRGVLVDAAAEGAVEALVITPHDVRALLVAEAELGERIMRALILRRVNIIRSVGGGPAIIGAAGAGDVIRLEGFLTRNGYPHHLLDPAADPEAHELINRYAPGENDLPLVITADGTVLRNPTENALARQLGMVDDIAPQDLYDVLVVGAGPAGLATAVYAASEGLTVAVLDARAFGGQAGASARIENYFGFPTGISGQALAARAFVQAQKFGAEMLIPVRATGLDCARTDGAFKVAVDSGEPIRARAIVVASGARYRRPQLANLDQYEGRGVWYWASPIEARLCQGEPVVLVGGGNSAGQAAVYLSAHASSVKMMVRGPSLASSMSHYLVERITATDNIEILFDTALTALEGGEHRVETVHWMNHASGMAGQAAIRNVFLFVGADPATEWLKECAVLRDDAGFVLTGAKHCALNNPGASMLESSVPGVFAVGDVRSGSVKRVGSAIGEGAQVTAALHVFLADHQMPAL